jgi:hypothetical protein
MSWRQNPKFSQWTEPWNVSKLFDNYLISQMGPGAVFTTFYILYNHRHLSNKNCLTARTTCLVCFISTVNGHSKKKRKKEKKAKNVVLVAGT